MRHLSLAILLALALPSGALATPHAVEGYAVTAAYAMGANALNMSYHPETGRQSIAVVASESKIRRVSGERWTLRFSITDKGLSPAMTCTALVVAYRDGYWIPPGRTGCPDEWIPWSFTERDPQTRVIGGRH